MLVLEDGSTVTTKVEEDSLKADPVKQPSTSIQARGTVLWRGTGKDTELFSGLVI